MSALIYRFGFSVKSHPPLSQPIGARWKSSIGPVAIGVSLHRLWRRNSVKRSRSGSTSAIAQDFMLAATHAVECPQADEFGIQSSDSPAQNSMILRIESSSPRMKPKLPSA